VGQVVEHLPSKLEAPGSPVYHLCRMLAHSCIGQAVSVMSPNPGLSMESYSTYVFHVVKLANIAQN
jgi:hypothetical protein